jgi:hypothetical protein
MTVFGKKRWPFSLDYKSCQGCGLAMLDVVVILDPVTATVAYEPVRIRLLAELAQPASAATPATRLGIARHHLRVIRSRP